MDTNTPSFEEVFKDFAKGIELPDLELDDEGNAEILCGEDLVLNIHYDPEIAEILFYAEVADIDGAPDPEALLLEMLRANFFWMDTRGFTLAMDHDSMKIVLTGKESESTFIHADTLATYINAMLETIYEFRQKIHDHFMKPIQDLIPDFDKEGEEADSETFLQ